MELKFHTHSGMSVPITEGDNEDCREAAADYLLTARAKGHDVCTVEKGKKYEVISQSNSQGMFVTDDDGLLVLWDG